MNNVSNSENTTQEIQHENTLYAEPVFEVAGFSVTNAFLNSTATLIILVVFFIFIGKKMKQIPKGVQNVFEIVLEESLKLADSITGDRKKSSKFLPLVLALFLFILINNWLGLLPGVGTIGFIEGHEGNKMFVPFFRGGTADLNLTLALALISVVVSHILGVISVGAWTYLNRFLNFKVLMEIPKKFKKDPTVLFVNPIQAMVGLLEIVAEFAKIASLSFRLFGNIFAGEVLLASMMAIAAFFLPLPFVFMEIFVGFIQALVFAILVLVFMSMSTTSHEH